MVETEHRSSRRGTADPYSSENDRIAAVTRVLVAAAVLGLALFQPPELRAQGIPLSQVLLRLFGDELVLRGGFHEGHFRCEECRGAADSLNQSLVSQLASSPPVNSSAGGFTYEYDPVAGTYERTSDSFGPIFAERPDTLGKGRFNYGVSSIFFEYDSLDDVSLTDGELIFDLSHEDVTGDDTALDNFVEGDLVEAQTFLDLRSGTTTFFVNWGVTDRIDLALVVPLVSVDLVARVDATVRELATEGHRDATGSKDEPVHLFTGDADSETFVSRGSASGIGDVIVRGKYNFSKHEGRGMSAAAEIRLPTGDEADLLGVGETQVKLFLIGSTKLGKVSSHANLGYTLSGGDLPDELNFAAGFDSALHPRVTVALDLLSRTLFDADQLRRTENDHFFRVCDPPDGPPCAGSPDSSRLPIGLDTRRSLEIGKSDQNLAYASLGLKFNPWKNLLLTVNMLYSLTSDGLQDEDVIPLVGVDYSF